MWRKFASLSCSTGYIKRLTVTAVPFHECIQFPVPVVGPTVNVIDRQDIDKLQE